MEEGQWEQEKLRRLECLKCGVCGGINIYICECAKQAYLKEYKVETIPEWEYFARKKE